MASLSDKYKNNLPFDSSNVTTITSNYTALNNDIIFVNTASSALTVTLPASPTAGSKIKILDSASNATNNNITINGNGNKIGGSLDNYVIGVVDSIVSIIFINSSKGWFLENSFVPLDVPGKPTSASAVDIGTGRAYNNGAATVTFAASDSGGIADYYEVVSSPGAISASGAFSPIIVTGLESGIEYSFAVRSKNAAGNSAYSTSSNSITATTVPQAPTINSATAGVGLVTISYSANGTGGKSITNFIANSNPSSITSSASASSITFLDTLVNGTPYTFTLTATNANGTSAVSTASSSATPFTSSGGTITTTGGYRIHSFTGTAGFTYTGATRNMEYLIVAGGGGGNRASQDGDNGGGGGAGGFKSGTSSITTGSYNIVVGGGGGVGIQGSESSFNSIVSTGGGRGGQNSSGGTGGSGGGGSMGNGGGSGTAGQGSNGGSGAGRDGGGGGGGGAGATGGNGGNGGALGGAGGTGLPSTITGSSVNYAGGGGGGGSWYNNNGGGAGGAGGGGAGGSSGSSGSANTGGGGGGAFLGGAAGGGSGIVIVRYLI